MAEQAKNIKIAAWLGGTGGRAARVILGAVLIIAGVAIGGVGGTIVALIGLVPIGLGMSNRCLISKAIGAPWKGEDAIDMANS